MELITLKAEIRKEFGKRVTRQLRADGRIPVVIYGHGQAPEGASIDAHQMRMALRHGIHMLQLDLNGRTSPFLIKEVQYDHLQKNPVHLDLARVDLTERVRVRVGIELRGQAKGLSEGGVLDLVMADVEVECLPSDIPDVLHPSVTDLGLNEFLQVKDLVLPQGVVAVSPPDSVVARVRPVAEEVAAPVGEGVEETSQPERITRPKSADEE